MLEAECFLHLQLLFESTNYGVPKPTGNPQVSAFCDKEDSFGIPDFKLGSQPLLFENFFLGSHTFRTGLTLNYVDSEHDNRRQLQRNLILTVTLDAPNYVHRVGSFTTVDWQISYPCLVTTDRAIGSWLHCQAIRRTENGLVWVKGDFTRTGGLEQRDPQMASQYNIDFWN